MLIPAASHFMVSRAFQRQIRFQPQWIKGHGVKLIYLIFNILYGNAAYPADCTAEISVDQIVIQSDGFKNLGALIGLNGGNTHFGSNLDNAVKHRVIIIIYRRIVIFIQHPVINQLLNGLLSQIGIDGTGAVA